MNTRISSEYSKVTSIWSNAICLSLWGYDDESLVQAYAIKDDGAKDVEFDSVLTDVNNNYSIDLVDIAGPVIVEVLK